MIFRTLVVVAVLTCVISVVGARRVHRGHAKSIVPNDNTHIASTGEGAPAPRRRAANPADLVRSFKGFSCPGKYGRYPLAEQCDKYIECKDGVAEEKSCPDGLLFNSYVPYADPCGYPIDVDCTGRENVQPAIPTKDCPHQFGYYRIGDAKHCGQFMNCATGHGYVLDCPEGLAFNPASYQCDWPDQVPECDAASFLGFQCPPPKILKGLNGEEIEDPKLRTYRSDKNCQKYIICLKSGPRLLGCGEDRAYDEETGTCVDIDKIETCAPESRKHKGKKVNEEEEPLLDVRYGSNGAVRGRKSLEQEAEPAKKHHRHRKINDN